MNGYLTPAEVRESLAWPADQSHLRKTVSRRIYRGPYSYEEHMDRGANSTVQSPAR